jgi:hypothetical protein
LLGELGRQGDGAGCEQRHDGGQGDGPQHCSEVPELKSGLVR